MKEAPETRQAERQALNGGHLRLSRGDWGRIGEQPPLLDETSTRYPKKRQRKSRKKERCPVNKTHEWMKDKEEIPLYQCRWDGPDKLVGSVQKLYRLCVHCGKTQYKRNGRWFTEKNRPWYVGPEKAIRYSRYGPIWFR